MRKSRRQANLELYDLVPGKRTRRPARARKRPVTLKQLVKRFPERNEPVLVFPNVSTFRSTVNKYPASKKKIAAFLSQKGGGFRRIQA